MVLERADRSRTLFNQTLKLKEQVRQ